jgi:Colicin V production protein.
MNYIDIAFLILFAVIMIRGFFRGFVKEAISIAGLFFCLFWRHVRYIEGKRFLLS